MSDAEKKPDENELTKTATQQQRLAASPSSSVWVSASAGTGKTRVLVDRVLRLLLSGVPPGRLLCLTYTKAAAAEMRNRVIAQLAAWSTLEDAALTEGLAQFLGKKPVEVEEDLIQTARRLFARVLEAPGGMRITTLHSFCQSLLQRFPLEAGIAPHFQVAEDRMAKAVLAAAREDVLHRAAPERGFPALAEALRGVVANVHETNFSSLLSRLIADRGRLEHFFNAHGGLSPALTAVYATLEVPPGLTPDIILRTASEEEAFDGEGCRKAAAALALGTGTNDPGRAAKMSSWLAQSPEARLSSFETYQSVFLTAEGEIRKRIFPAPLQKKYPALSQVMVVEAERIASVIRKIEQARTAFATASLLTLGHALLETYEAAKKSRSLMDFDDLTLAARDLLSRSDVASWVLYKLDGGIDHILLDEAQDTNPDQWKVLKALTEEFFASYTTPSRTLFVVGDVKQSIYSFQKADPKIFGEMHDFFLHKDTSLENPWKEIPLNLSFRSTEPIISLVNALLAKEAPARIGLAPPSVDLSHLAKRQGQAGKVELWPLLVPSPKEEKEEPWTLPLERKYEDSPQTRLARLVAERIRAMIGTERLESQGRTVRARDILILLRKRSGFAEELIREMKKSGVPVAGADRMILAEQIAVMDLLALARILLLPEDDLTLATVLKSPLVGLNEEQLFQVAWGRKGSLWEALKTSVDPIHAKAWEKLSALFDQVDVLTPHALFAEVLGPLGGRKALVARLGTETEDALDEFLTLTLTYEAERIPSLQDFVRWFDSEMIEIKRDMDTGGGDAVRVMTIHGAKGLEAPVVFLPDTGSSMVSAHLPSILWAEGKAADLGAEGKAADIPLWRCGNLGPPALKAAQDKYEQSEREESHRLLYVAVTRAKDQLIICGHLRTQGVSEKGCWHTLIQGAMKPIAAEIPAPFLAAIPCLSLSSSPTSSPAPSLLRIVSDQTARPDIKEESLPAEEKKGLPSPLPAWVSVLPTSEPTPPRPLVPSRLGGEDLPVMSPLSSDKSGKTDSFRRGNAIHALLQSLPTIPREQRGGVGMRYLAKVLPELDSADRLQLVAEVETVLEHPTFAPLFGPDSRAEVPIAGLIGEGYAISGRIDRLVVRENDVLIADYKSNRRPPSTLADVPPAYLQQMAAYRLALACVYPGKTVRCALVWTDGPLLMEIRGDKLA